MDFEWVLQPMVCSTLYDYGHRRNHQKTWRFQWECMGISSNFCWRWIFQQAMELITMNLTRRFCYDWIYRTIKYIKIRIIEPDSSVSQSLGIPHFMVIFMWIMIIIPKKTQGVRHFQTNPNGGISCTHAWRRFLGLPYHFNLRKYRTKNGKLTHK